MRQTQNKTKQKTDSTPKPEFTKLAIADAQKYVPDTTSEIHPALPAGSSLPDYILAVSVSSKSNSWVVTDLAEVGGRITSLSIKSCIS